MNLNVPHANHLHRVRILRDEAPEGPVVIEIDGTALDFSAEPAERMSNDSISARWLGRVAIEACDAGDLDGRLT